MASDAQAMRQEWRIREGAPPSIPAILAAVDAAAAECSSLESGVWAVPVLAGLREQLDIAWNLNLANSSLPAFAARLLRRQGRIDRALRDAAEQLARAMDCIPSFRASEARPRIFDALWRAKYCIHAARGGPLMRRIGRPQDEFNASLALALREMGDFLLAPASGLHLQGASEAVGQLEWHARELSRISGLRGRRLSWLRRMLRNQREINRCAVMTIKFAAGVLEAGAGS